MERISAANSAVSVLQDNLASKDHTNLQRLVQVLQEMKEYIEDITKYNKVQKFLEAKTVEQKFKDLRKEYDDSISLFNFDDFKKFNTQEEDNVLLEVQSLAEIVTVEIISEVKELYKTVQHNRNIT